MKKVNFNWNELRDEKKKELIKSLGDGLVFLICRRLRLDYFELKKKLGL